MDSVIVDSAKMRKSINAEISLDIYRVLICSLLNIIGLIRLKCG